MGDGLLSIMYAICRKKKAGYALATASVVKRTGKKL